MLPNRNDDAFPAALRAARIERKLNMKQLANLIGIHGAMIGRYEDTGHSWHSKPSQQTWERLNNELFGNTDLTVTNSTPDYKPQLQSEKALKDVSVEEIVNELQKRGAVSVQIQFSK